MTRNSLAASILTSLVLAIAACGGSSAKAPAKPESTLPDCDDAQPPSGEGTAMGSGVTGPAQTADPNAPPSPPPTQAELDEQEKAIAHTGPGLPMGPDVPPCRAKSGPPSPVPPTDPPAPAS
jgi:hypothetical protein